MINIKESQLSYIPLLSVRPAEIIALRELPEATKANMLPHIMLRPWLGSGTLARAMDKVLHAYPDRCFSLELDEFYQAPSGSNLELEMKHLRDETGGFSNWIKFLEKYPRVIPTIQLRDAEHNLHPQLAQLKRLGRGAVIRVPKHGLATLTVVEAALKQLDFLDVLFILDFEETDARFLAQQAIALSSIRKISEQIANPYIALSSTSFPSAFAGIERQSIYERSFFRVVSQGTNQKLIYSDRGSARLPRDGGGGVPAPRIDLPSKELWEFFRKQMEADAPKSERIEAYSQMAEMAMHSDSWDPNLNIWGTQMIKMTQMKSEFAIISPVRSTSVRINIHLFRQATYGYAGPLSSVTEDPWED